MTTNNYNVGIYCRLSKDDNNLDESTSISNQKNLLLQFLLNKGWNLHQIYVDDGYSGTNFNRPAFQQMIQDIELNKINCVITKDLSRFGRDRLDSAKYRQKFVDLGIRFIAIHDDHDNLNELNPTANYDISTPIKEMMNEMYAAEISRKTRATKKLLAEQGKFANSRAPYGYLKSPNNKHSFIIDKGAANIVKRIYDMFLKGYSGKFIADTFNQEGIPTPNIYYYQSINKPNPYTHWSNLWSSGTILNIIRNPVYTGAMVQGKRKVVSFKNSQIIKNPTDNWIIVEDMHEAIIDKNIWDEAQQITTTNHMGIRRNSSGQVSMFSGLIYCGDCGTRMTYSRRERPTYTDQYYRCGRYNKQGSTACPPHTIKHETLYNTVMDNLNNFSQLTSMEDNEIKNFLIKAKSHHTGNNKQKLLELLREKENRLKEINHMTQTLYEQKINGVITENMFISLTKTYENEQLAITEDIQQINLKIIKIKELSHTDGEILNWIETIKHCLTTQKLTREFAVKLIDRIEVAKTYDKYGTECMGAKVLFKFNLNNINIEAV